MTKEKDNNCTCGHFLGFHGDPFNGTNIDQCWHYKEISVLKDGSRGFDYDCLCTKFKQDNLRYLEQIYERSHATI